MWNSGDSFANSDRVVILALNQGAGHRVRMEALAERLRRIPIPAVVHILAAEGPQWESEVAAQVVKIIGSERTGTIVADARDLNPSLFPGDVPTIAVDNLHANRFHRNCCTIFFDTLPHPELDEAFLSITRNILIDEDVRGRARRPISYPSGGPTRVTLYAGPETFLPAHFVEAFDTRFRDDESFFYTRVGGERRNGVYSVPYLTRNRYLDLLLDTDVLITYPGMSFWEGLFLGAAPLLIETGSDVHDTLSSYIASRMGATVLKATDLDQADQMILDARSRSLSFDMEAWRGDVLERSGMDRLADRVEELWNESRKKRISGNV